MAQPQAYNRETDFTERDGDDTNHPGINIELDAAAQSINEIRDNLALIQRDDGALQNGIVTAESLAPSAFDAVLVEVNLAVTDAQTAATSANNAAVSANTARDTAVAAKDTAVTSANAAALNATTATTKAAESSASATASQTSATASANSATASQTSRLASEAARDAAQAAQAAASASQTATATSEANASASATTATTQAGIATTQAGIATTQATNAQASATAAAASLDSFDDRYLGSKTADPTTDNDGNPLITGALYFNSVAGEMRVWAGTFWKATGSSVGGTINTANYTATAGQTDFAIVYDVGFVHVYLNGLKLESGVDFTANNGTSVVLATGATAGDVVDMIAFGIFSVANTYTRPEADSLLALKANTADVNDALALKADQATTYTKAESDAGFVAKTSATGAALMPVGTTAQRPASPQAGMFRQNSTTGLPEWYDTVTGRWIPFSEGSTAYQVEYLVVGGGAGGGCSHGGGGGAGGYRTGSQTVTAGTSYSLTVGAGGAGGATSGSAGSLGGASSLFSLTSSGGGGGGSRITNNSTTPGQNGASGGGGAGTNPTTAGTGTAGQGNNGGAGSSDATAGNGGGGGGASAAGGAGSGAQNTGSSGAGGNGTQWLNGNFYAGGGSGGRWGTGTVGAAGLGGGGVGGGQDQTGGNASINTGGGGGGGGDGVSPGGAGGSGIVIIRYAGAPRATGGTITESGGFTTHTFTSSGTFTA